VLSVKDTSRQARSGTGEIASTVEAGKEIKDAAKIAALIIRG
jgi:hypothetical protein